MMMLRRPYFAKMAMVAASMAAFAAGGHFVATTAISHQQSKQLEELARIVLRRSEVAVDFGVATLDDITRRGRMNCDSASLQAVRLQVYQRSAVKDIRLVNQEGSVICSAYSETLEFDNEWVTRPQMLRTSAHGVLIWRRNHHAFPAEMGDGLLRKAEIVGQQMTRCFCQPIGKAAFAIGAVVQHPDDLGIFRPDVLDRVPAIAWNIGAVAGRQLRNRDRLSRPNSVTRVRPFST